MNTSANIVNIPNYKNLSLKNLPNEIWGDIYGYENSHKISSYGRVKSLCRKIKCRNGFRTSKDKILKQNIKKTGYCEIQLKHGGKTILVHRLVATCFIKNIEKKPQVNHIDGNKCNNKLENLEWVTQSENMKHAYRLGLQVPKYNNPAKGEAQGLSKLKEIDVIWIRKNYKKGLGRVFGEKFNVSPECIQNVVNKKTWKHVI